MYCRIEMKASEGADAPQSHEADLPVIMEDDMAFGSTEFPSPSWLRDSGKHRWALGNSLRTSLSREERTGSVACNT
jgi:hypothetical protein